MTSETTRIETLSIIACEPILVMDAVLVGIIFERITTWSAPERSALVVSVAEYRQLLGDYTSEDKRIVERLQYLESFCRNIIRPEIQKHYDKGKEVVTRQDQHQSI